MYRKQIKDVMYMPGCKKQGHKLNKLTRLWHIGKCLEGKGIECFRKCWMWSL